MRTRPLALFRNDDVQKDGMLYSWVLERMDKIDISLPKIYRHKVGMHILHNAIVMSIYVQ